MTPSSERSSQCPTTFREALEIEAEAIRDAAARIDPDVAQAAVEKIAASTGKIVVSGTGKSGVIAQKIAQTLTSIGTVAIYVHPSDAIHGGLGVVSGGDVVIVLSNSGETDEVTAILPTLASRGVEVIAITGNAGSTLARKASVVLDASVTREACPLGLAPTASTTVALAIGDALAVAVMERKGVTADEFAANHPAGRLGRRLTIRVADLMGQSPDIPAGTSWLEVVKAISQHSLGAVNIVDGDGRLIGIVTDGDLRRTLERVGVDGLASLTAEQMMTPGPVTADADMLAFDALRLMEDRPSQISVLPVVNADGRCVGLIRLHDIVRSGLA